MRTATGDAQTIVLFGGTSENKVVTTLARVFFDAGHVVARPNFRGVGESEGTHDEGNGETEDLALVLHALRARFGPLPAVLAGFFGAFTTFSAFAYDVAVLWQQGRHLTALADILLQNLIGLAGMALGLWFGGGLPR
jgi:hypothetical protein